ncbi:PEP-CTERM system histidine kinase PrsK [Photobacterium sp. WH77]|uniref:XrtA/PEP-CTERM system histidine kinase PrsK n=1 Tax=unclassified Photobacterium TaxID=2628852 RepID=UPI001EDA68AE|nr:MULTISPECIES: XrtA/PEP-CTERM system histidine kinase PrsK [unclassified Photobacterium]MCG2837217.1 PEP-CTERM system histidine kinase PrsK [Photobacterium sp. WH77]MCG2844833.1 PEP-CTERM system histidine kinase PrsK [Photobacterium sp. WH80]
MDTLLGNIGYLSAATGFLFIFLLLLTTKEKSMPKRLLQLTCLLGAAWAITSFIQYRYQLSILPVLLTESLLTLGWCLLVSSSLTNTGQVKDILREKAPRWLCLFIAATIVLELARFIWPVFGQRTFLFLHLCQAIIGLWFVELRFRRTHKDERWAIKPICLGLGVYFAYHFALYADAFLTNILASGFWLGRGWIALMSLPFILLTARRIKHWQSRVYVSRDIIYHSTLLLVAAGYLLVMALAGFYIKSMGESWSDTVQVLFFALSALVLASLFLSDTFRKNIMVFITKHFFANKYEYREEWMRFATALEHPEGTQYDTALRAMLHPFGCHSGVLATRNGPNMKVRACHNIDSQHRDIQLLLSSAALPAIEHQWIVDIDAAKQDKEPAPFRLDATALSTVAELFYIVPLSSSSGTLGVCLLSRPTSTEKVNWEDRDLMKAISRQLSVYLTVFETNQKLAESQQFDTFNRMSAFLVHDLKNVLAQLQLLSKNATKHRDNPDFISDAFDTVDSAAHRLTKVLNQLNNKRVESQSEEEIDIEDLIRQVCDTRAVRAPEPQFIEQTSLPFTLKTDRERFSNILSHLVQNAQESTSENGFVHVSTTRKDHYYLITISDNGSGMSSDFIEHRLFKPFDTTKGNAGMGIGAYDAKNLIEQLGGYIDVESEPDKGTTLYIHLPVSVPA